MTGTIPDGRPVAPLRSRCPRGSGLRAALLAAAAAWLVVASPARACAQVVGRAVMTAPNTLTPAERAAGWTLLFDGTTLRGWRGLGRDTVPTAHWVAERGTIRKIPSGTVPRQADGQPLAGGDLMTVTAYDDFELSFEWKVSPGANSGVKYNVSEPFSLQNAGNHAALGFEYQVLDDDRHEDGKLPSHRSAALYDLIEPDASKTLRPVGQWNQSRIIYRGTHGEHWLNGAKVVEFDLGTPRMDSLLAKSKYRTIAGFGERRRGHIVLQDHGDEVWYRSLKLRTRVPAPNASGER